MSVDNVALHAETFLKALVDNGIGKRKEAMAARQDPLGIVFVGHSLGGIMIKLVSGAFHGSVIPPLTEARLW